MIRLYTNRTNRYTKGNNVMKGAIFPWLQRFSRAKK